MTVLFAGCEEMDFQWMNCQAPTFTQPSFGAYLDANSLKYRVGYQRYALCWVQNYYQSYWAKANFMSASSNFWLSARVSSQGYGGNGSGGNIMWTLLDASGNIKLWANNTSGVINGAWTIQKRTNALVATTLGSPTTVGYSVLPNTPDKIDVYVNYAVSGQIIIYMNGVQIYSYSGDVTTDSNTSISGFGIYPPAQNSGNGGSNGGCFSEVIAATFDTRAAALVTTVGGPSGNTDTFSGPGTPVPLVTPGWTNSATVYSFNSSGIFYSRFQALHTGQIVSSNTAFSGAVTGTTQMAVYADNGTFTRPGALMGSSNTLVNPTTGSNTYTWTNGPVLVAGQYYWGAVRSTGTMNFLQNNSNGGSQGWTQTSVNAAFPDPATFIALTNNYVVTNFTLNVAATGNPAINTGNPDASATAAQIQEYQILPGLPAGATFAIAAVVQKAQVVNGSTGPTKFDFMVRTASTDYLSPDVTANNGWATYGYSWDTNPNTSAPWAMADIVSLSTSFNMGIKSVT